MATPPQASQPQQPQPQTRKPYTEALSEAIARFNAALEAFNGWKDGYAEVCRELYEAARQMRAVGVLLPPMPGEPAPTPRPYVDPDTEVRNAIKNAEPLTSKPPVTTSTGTPKTSKE